MQGFDFKKVATWWCSTYHMNLGKEGLFLGLQIGSNVHSYLIPLALVKTLHRKLGEMIENYESKNGEIDETRTSSGIQSPLA